MANTRIGRTVSSAGSRRKATFSAWLKRAKLGESWIAKFGGTYAQGNYMQIGFNSADNCFIVGDGGPRMECTAKFRDTNAWYHYVVAFDTEQSTASNRLKFYINGELITDYGTATYPTLNQDLNFNMTGSYNNAWLGGRGESTYEYSGIMSHVHWIDGTAYDASAFGSTDAVTGEWKINTSPNVTYGTNGYFMLKDGNSLTDASGNGNNFSLLVGTLTKAEDCPSNVFATGNNLATYWTAATFANGNTTQTTQSNNYAFNTSTLGFKTGKFYWEAKIVSSAQSDMFGITGRTNAGATTNELGKYSDQYAFNSYSGVSRNNSTDTSYTSQFNSNGTIVQIAVDMTNLKIHLGVNGVWQNSSNPSNNTGGLAIGAISTTTDGYYFVGIGDYSNSAGTHSYNFGNGYFGTTAVSSAGANASGNGIFEYDVPTGYTALSTKGLNL